MMDKDGTNVYEGECRVKVAMVCECGNVREKAYYDHSHGAFCVYNGYTYICDQCGKEMERRITKISTEVTETETEIEVN